jgi:hypothetical protein
MTRGKGQRGYGKAVTPVAVSTWVPPAGPKVGFASVASSRVTGRSPVLGMFRVSVIQVWYTLFQHSPPSRRAPRNRRP